MLSIPGYLKLDPDQDFLLSEKIGSGVSGVVYKAKMTSPRDGIENAAVKMIVDPDSSLFKFEIALMGYEPLF